MIAVVGLSHKSAPIDIRERLAVPRDEIPALLQALAADPAIAEALVLGTCNRVEVVVAGAGGRDDLPAAVAAALRQLEARAPGIGRYAYRYTGAEAVAHLFRVASSLDSMVLGEPQILGQLKAAYEIAQRAGTVGPRLHRAVPRAIRAAKRVRTETAVGTGQVSVPSVAVDLARQIFGELDQCLVALIGAGEMAEAVARLLGAERARLVVVARDRTRASELADRVGGQPRLLTELGEILPAVDVVITSTSAPGYVVSHEQVAAGHRARRGRSLFFIDLAVPRDVDPRVAELERVFAYNIDDFSEIVEESFAGRRREAEIAETIIRREAQGFDRWLDATEQVTPAIVALRAQFEQVLEDEIDRSLRGRLRHLDEEDRSALTKMREAAVNKLLHVATIRLRETAQQNADGGEKTEQLLGALAELFEVPLEAARASDPGSSPTSRRSAPRSRSVVEGRSKGDDSSEEAAEEVGSG